jgi:Flp pilus assembly protein CpaB
MVEAAQAQALQLAQEHGRLSLTLRNPQDLSVGKTQVASLRTVSDNFFEPEEALPAPSTPAATSDKPKDPTPPPAAKTWDVMLIRGDKVETVTVPMPK